jgi:membrane-bound lytic murein transglycosylase D
VHVDNRYSLPQLAEALQMDIEELKYYNPAIRKGIIPFSTDKIPLTLPYNKAILFTQLGNDTEFKSCMDEKLIALNTQIEKEKLQPKNKTILYKVKRGELLAGIANKYDVTVNELKKWNHLKSSKITAGKRIKIRVQNT